MKLVINSHIKYSQPLFMLFKSMIDVGFEDFKSDVILVVGGCEKDVEPTMMNIQEIFPEAPSIRCTVIQTAFDNWEYTGYHMLHVHKDHHLVFSDRYLFIHDTCIVGPLFLDRYKECKVWQPPIDYIGAWLFSVQKQTVSNIYLFSREVVLNYKDNFKTKLTKGEGVSVEMGNPRKGVRPVVDFGRRFVSDTPRIREENKDIYGTGVPRTPYWYPVFALRKWILMWMHGDIDGKIRKNKPEMQRIPKPM